jgi:FK506-binding protein 2
MKVSVLGVVSLVALLVSASTEELQIGILKAIPEEECTVKTKAGDFISVHYEGSLEDGTIFDASYSRGQPITFQLGVGQVIPGWDQGLTRMCIGEKRKLIIPPNLGYGNAGIGPIPPKATLTFIAELVDIAGAKKAPEMDEL